jgi:hypothetical protein
VQIEASTFVAAPPATVYAVYADYRGWPQLFSTIKAVHVVSQDGPRVVLAIDHREGPVRNEIEVRPPDTLELWEVKRHYDARFSNRFEPVAGGSLFTVHATIRLKGWARLLRPFLRPYVRSLIRRLQLLPVRLEAEARARPGVV